jgi:hypothetical protein
VRDNTPEPVMVIQFAESLNVKEVFMNIVPVFTKSVATSWKLEVE